MRTLLLIVLLAGCGNPKDEIVEQQKIAQDEITRADIKVSLFKEDARKAQRDHKNPATVFRLADSVRSYEYKKARLQGQFDSLEMEIKKY